MKKTLLALFGLVGLFQVTALAQVVTVKVEFDQDRFLPHETLIAKVQITNFSGRTLQFGEDDQWLNIDVLGRRDIPVNRRGIPLPVEGAFTLENATKGTRRINLAPYFELTELGHYRVAASIRVPELGAIVRTSRYGEFDIISGTKLWDLDFGVPYRTGSSNKLLEVRKFALIQVTHLQEMVLYFRLTNQAETETLALDRLGRMVSFGRLEPQIDQESNLHLLYQNGARSIRYFTINAEGEMLARQTFQIADSRPRLRRTDSGTIEVVGGARVLSADDINPPLADADNGISETRTPATPD